MEVQDVISVTIPANDDESSWQKVIKRKFVHENFCEQTCVGIPCEPTSYDSGRPFLAVGPMAPA